ncbi:MAG: hypothetical protein JWM98_3422 [Thermoleophilia bacterium]|nr:hypothetical protein [Thermoleophilia bacterium]
MDRSFIAYIGTPAIHDGHIVKVRSDGTRAEVDVEGSDGTRYRFDFDDLAAIVSDEPAGMILYAVSEMTAEAPNRHFSFVNWDEDDSRQLEITAGAYTCTPLP